MENEKQNYIPAETKEIDFGSVVKKYSFILVSILVFSSVAVGSLAYSVGFSTGTKQKTSLALQDKTPLSALEKEVLPSDGVTLPVVWGDLGVKLVDAGVIDAKKFEAIYQQRGTFTDEYKNLLLGNNNGKLKITSANSGYLLNMLWALGLGNKSAILEKGEMVDPRYGGAQKFASTGGWTIAQGNGMDHYSKHDFIVLTPEQQALVDKVSRGIYRPCCGNSVHFPDCNHGMAMLGLLELMASQGVSEQDMWNTALTVNSFWFPNNYMTIATYMKSKGTDWKNVNAQEVLGANYSSSQGYANIASQVVAPQSQSGGGSGCGVDAGPAIQQQNGCGI